MNTTELVARCRAQAFLNDNEVDWTAAIIDQELTDRLTQTFVDPVVASKSAFWTKSVQVSVVSGRAAYRLPLRACAGGLQRVQIAYDSNLNWLPLDEVDEQQAIPYEVGINSTGTPVRCVLRGDELHLLPRPDNGTYTLRVFYYVRPSRLVPTQTAGLITSVNAGAGTVTVNSAPVRYALDNTTTSALIVADAVDIVSSAGWCDVRVPGAVITNIASQTYTLSGLTANDFATIIPNVDYLRAAEQAEYPQLPVEFHRLLADLTAVKILNARTMTEKEEQLLSRTEGDMARFLNLLKPRNQATSKSIVMPGNLYRGSFRGLWRWP